MTFTNTTTTKHVQIKQTTVEGFVYKSDKSERSLTLKPSKTVKDAYVLTITNADGKKSIILKEDVLDNIESALYSISQTKLLNAITDNVNEDDSNDDEDCCNEQ